MRHCIPDGRESDTSDDNFKSGTKEGEGLFAILASTHVNLASEARCDLLARCSQPALLRQNQYVLTSSFTDSGRSCRSKLTPIRVLPYSQQNKYSHASNRNLRLFITNANIVPPNAKLANLYLLPTRRIWMPYSIDIFNIPSIFEPFQKFSHSPRSMPFPTPSVPITCLNKHDAGLHELFF